MKKLNNKAKISTIALVLTLTIAVVLITYLPAATAQLEELDTPLETKAFLSFSPDPAVGVGQMFLVNAWIAPPPLWSMYTYENYVFTFTSPAGATETVTIPESEQPGTIWFNYILTQIGTWTLRFDWAGDENHKPATVTREIVVQQDPIPSWPDTPLPTDAWDYPINIENREWYQISGPWFQSSYNASKGDWNQYSEGPDTAHILWKIPPVGGVGGLIGGEYGTDDYYSDADLRFETVMAGRAYDAIGGNIYCADIRTGEILWTVPGNFHVGAIRSSTPVLYYFGSSNFRVYDALTGEITLDVPGISRFAFVDPYVYSMDNYTTGQYGARLIKWTTAGSTSDFQNRVIWNVSYPDNDFSWGWDGAIWGDYLATRQRLENYTDTSFFQQPDRRYPSATLFRSALIFDLTDGSLLHNTTSSGYRMSQGPMVGASYGKFYWPYEEPLTWVAFDLATGAKAWDSYPPADYPWGNFWAYSCTAGYDMVYALGYPGIWAFDIETGETEWVYRGVADEWGETPYGTWPFGSRGAVLGDGKLYAPNTEHSPTRPWYRGWQLHAVDAFTGDGIWTIQGYYRVNALAEGTLHATNEEDGYAYCFSKGETATTVSASSKVISKGSSILIEGTVLDMSPAQAGTAAISDASMSAWMEYLHMQQPLPMDAEGVSVTLNAIDPNGNFIDIGTATSDTDGEYAILWTPTIEGKYRIVATFEGSNSYYASHATTYIGVEPAPSPAQPIEPEPMESLVGTKQTEPTEAPFITTEVAIIAAVVAAVVIGIAAFWALRKRQ